MERRYKHSYLVMFLLLGFGLFCNYLLAHNLDIAIIVCIGTLLFLGCVYFLLGYQKPLLNIVMRKVSMQICLFSIIYFLIINFLSFVFNNLDIKENLDIWNFILLVVYIIAFELIRYIVIRANSDKKEIKVLFVVVLIIFEILLIINNLEDLKLLTILNFFTFFIGPVVLLNILLTYLTSYLSYLVCIFFRIILAFNWFYFILGINKYLELLLFLILCLVVYKYSFKYISYYIERERVNYMANSSFKLIDLIILVSSFLIFLVSVGLTKYKFLAIASNSMNPVLKLGDAVLIDKEIEDNELAVGDIIVYAKEGEIIVHRIIEIVNDDGKIYYTKGDNNRVEDNILLTLDDINGKVKLILPNLGMPSLKLKELLGVDD